MNFRFSICEFHKNHVGLYQQLHDIRMNSSLKNIFTKYFYLKSFRSATKFLFLLILVFGLNSCMLFLPKREKCNCSFGKVTKNKNESYTDQKIRI